MKLAKRVLLVQTLQILSVGYLVKFSNVIWYASRCAYVSQIITTVCEDFKHCYCYVMSRMSCVLRCDKFFLDVTVDNNICATQSLCVS